MRMASVSQIPTAKNRKAWREGFALAAMCLSLLAVPLQAQSAKSLQQVHRLYVESFGPGKTDDLLRTSLIKRLEKTGGYIVIEDKNAADAIIRGSAEGWGKNYLAHN